MSLGIPVAIVTGGSSGIGLALVEHLTSRNWKVVVADIHPPKVSIDNILFIKTDVASWEDQANLFQQAYLWGGRLDFCALNAGIDDRDDIFNTISHDVTKPPRKPDMSTFSVNLIGTYYGIKLAAHYMSLVDTAAHKVRSGGKIIVTASGTGLFPVPAVPQYTSSKHGIVGLVRALGTKESANKANISINAVCPAIVLTASILPTLAQKLPADHFTPISTIIRCFDALAEFDHVGKEDWVENGCTGATLEGNGEELIWHHPSQRAAGKEGAKFDRERALPIIAEAYADKTRELTEQLKR